MLLILPAIVLPFLCLLFWSLGGGKSNAQELPVEVSNLLKADLPNAKLKDDAKMDKMGYYKQAENDSSKWREQLKQDPYTRNELAFPGIADTQSQEPLSFERSDEISPFSNTPADQTEQKVYAKLHQLQTALKDPASRPTRKTIYDNGSPASGLDERQVNRLSALVGQMHDRSDTSEDPELKELNGMLDKIMAIQHPEQVSKVSAPKVQNEKIKISGTAEATISMSRLDTTPSSGKQRFYSVDNSIAIDSNSNGLMAIIHEDQQVVNGARVKLRITQAFVLNGTAIPKDQFIYATVQLSSDCLQLTVAPFQFKGRIYPVDFSVYDLHGLPCIPVQGTITGDAARQSASQSLSGFGASAFDPSIAAQAASTGIQAARTLLTKKVKLVKVSVTAGHPLLLIPKLH